MQNITQSWFVQGMIKATTDALAERLGRAQRRQPDATPG